MATASDSAPIAHHSPRGSGSDSGAVEGAYSPQYRQRGGGGVSSPWTQIVRGGDSDLTSASSSSAAVAASTVGISIAAPPPSLSPSLSSVAEEQAMNKFSFDRSPSKVGAAAAAAASTSFSPEDGSGEAQPESSEHGSGGSNVKKPAWNVPSNGATEVGPVMGAVSWPALSESTRASPKSSSSESLKTLSDASVPLSQGTGAASPAAHKQGTNSNTNSNSTPNNALFSRQRSMKRGGGRNQSNSTPANGSPSQLPSPHGSWVDTASANSGKPANSAVDSSPRDNTHRDGGLRGGFGSQPHSGNEHQQQRNSFRRGSGGPHPRGDGSHYHVYGGRHADQDRGNQDWNPNRSFGSRDTHLPSHRVASRPFIRGPPPTPHFIPPTSMPVRPFATPIVYPEAPSALFYLPVAPSESIRAVTMVPQIPTYFFPPLDPQLHAKIVNQIEYYFSNENLIKDTFLRQSMDDQGWVSIKLIASFKKVMQLTDNMQLILDSIRTSSVVEVEGEKVRRRNDWARWIMPPSVPYSAVSSPQSLQKSSQDMLAANLQSIALDDKTAKPGYTKTYLSPSSSGEWSSFSQQSSGEKASQVAAQAGFPTSAPNPSK